MTVSAATVPRGSDDRRIAPMIPGAREPGAPTTVGRLGVVVLLDGPSTMDAATIAAHQIEGGGGPAQRRRAHQLSWWNVLARKLRNLLTGSRQA